MVPTVNTAPEKVQQQLQLLKDRSGIYKHQPPAVPEHIEANKPTAAVEKPSGSRSLNVALVSRTTTTSSDASLEKVSTLPVGVEDEDDDFRSEFF